MSKQREMVSKLAQIASTANMTLPNTDALSADVSFEQIEKLALECMALVQVGGIDEAATVIPPASQSSIEIKETAKGEPQVTVKAYVGSPLAGLDDEAITFYRAVRAKLAAPAEAAS